MDPQLPRYDPDMDDVFEDPDTYVLKPDKLHLYFESHKPDLLLYKVSVNVPDQDFPDGMRDEVHVKIVFQISSHKDFSKASLYYHMQGNTEQCVQSCLSAFACNQTVMYGIVVVVDGLKLVKVERQQNPNAAMEYNISETDLVTWDRTDAMHAMFEMIEGILWRNGKRVSFEWESGVQRRKPYLLGFFPFAAIPENSRELLSNN